MARYYGVERSEDFLAHYGVKGMRWGVRRALRDKPGRDKRLMRQYLKANNKLVKLKRKENIGNNKADAQYYGKIAKKALGIGLAGTSIGAAGHLINKGLLNKADKTWDKINHLQSEYNTALETIDRPTLHNLGQIRHSPSRTRLLEQRDEQIKQLNAQFQDIGKDLEKTHARQLENAHRAREGRNIGNLIAGAGLATAAVTGAKAANAKWRASDKGHAKMVQKRQNWEKEMRQAFKGTKYAGLPDTGPIIARQIAQKKKKRRS